MSLQIIFKLATIQEIRISTWSGHASDRQTIRIYPLKVADDHREYFRIGNDCHDEACRRTATVGHHIMFTTDQ